MADPSPRVSQAANTGVTASSGTTASGGSGSGPMNSMTAEEWAKKRLEVQQWANTNWPGKQVAAETITITYPRDLAGNIIGGPRYSFQFTDNTKAAALDTSDNKGFIPADYDPPPAARSAAEQVSAPPTQRTIVFRKPDGTYEEKVNPNYVDPDRVSPKDAYDMGRGQRADQIADQARADTAREKDTDRSVRAGERAEDAAERAADRSSRAALDKYSASVKQWEAEAAARREAAQGERDRLRFLLDERRITFDEAKEQYDRWWGENVELPFKQASEARARTKESNDALEAEQKHKDYVAEYEAKRAVHGYGAEQDVVKNQMALLKYQWGPTAPESFAANISALAKGKSGPGFQASDFRISLPKALSEVNGMSLDQAAARALKGWSPYAEQVANVAPVGYQTTDASGIPIPTAAGAPPPPMAPGAGMPQWTPAATAGAPAPMPQFPTITPYAPPAPVPAAAPAPRPTPPAVVPAPVPLPWQDPALTGGVQ